MWRIFHIILSVLQNTIVALNNVMVGAYALNLISQSMHHKGKGEGVEYFSLQ